VFESGVGWWRALVGEPRYTRDDAVALEIVRCSLLKVHIGFIQQDYSIPVARSLEIPEETELQGVRFMAQISCSDAEQRAFCILSHGL
jgi:hypothetical protein